MPSSPAASAPSLPAISWRRAAALLGLAALTVLAIATLPGLGEMRERFAGARTGWLVGAGVLELASVLAFVAAFRGVMCARLPWRLSYRFAVAAQGTNVLVPTGGAGGLAVAAWALLRTGMAAERVARRSVTLFVTTSSVNFFTAIAAALLVLGGLVPGEVDPVLAVVPAGAAALVIALAAGGPRVLDRLAARRDGRLTRPTSTALAGGLRDAGSFLRRPRSLVTLGAVGYMGFDLLSLAAAFQATGGAPEVGVLLIAYPLGQLGGLIPLPGGIGGTDGGRVGALVLYGTPLGAAAAAVLAYRVFQLGLPALLGAAALARLPHAVRRQPAAAASCNPAVA